ncbi:MAG: hypothetical protein EXR74_09465 [Bdellovibrionales bacterium]|nr:hypothetical protein [Bdellovibrionales bacterium]
MQIKLRVTIGLIFISTNLAFGNIFSYSLIGLPKEARSCHIQAKSVASHFEEQTKTKVAHIECTKETLTQVDFLIEYEASVELQFTSTDYSFDGVYQRGRYAEKEICDENLTKQTHIFELATGLKSLFSYCSHSEFNNKKPWAIIITGLGKSLLLPTLGGYTFYTAPKSIAYIDIFQGLKKALEKNGAILSDLIFTSSLVNGDANIHYYAKKRQTFVLEHITKTPKLEQCLAQAEEAKSFLNSSLNPPFTIYCGGPIFGEFELNLGFVNDHAISWKNSIEEFVTFDECQSHRDEVLSHYSGSTLNKLLGGFCSRNYENRKYQVVLLRDPR